MDSEQLNRDSSQPPDGRSWVEQQIFDAAERKIELITKQADQWRGEINATRRSQTTTANLMGKTDISMAIAERSALAAIRTYVSETCEEVRIAAITECWPDLARFTPQKTAA